MTTPYNTNPQYASMAWRRAIIGELVTYLTSTYTPAFGNDPEKVILSEEVFRADSEVPPEEIQQYITELEMEREALRLEMATFEFVKRNDHAEKPQQATAQANAPRAAKGKKGGKGTGKNAKQARGKH